MGRNSVFFLRVACRILQKELTVGFPPFQHKGHPSLPHVVNFINFCRTLESRRAINVAELSMVATLSCKAD